MVNNARAMLFNKHHWGASNLHYIWQCAGCHSQYQLNVNWSATITQWSSITDHNWPSLLLSSPILGSLSQVITALGDNNIAFIIDNTALWSIHSRYSTAQWCVDVNLMLCSLIDVHLLANILVATCHKRSETPICFQSKYSLYIYSILTWYVKRDFQGNNKNKNGRFSVRIFPTKSNRTW